ncbi:MAG: glycosyltransferase [Ferruginibacter sp.]
MISKNINKISKEKSILIVPLDWGLGHATRCIPLIKEFQAIGCNVIIAAEGAVKSLLENEFQQVIIIPCPQYRITYTKEKHWLALKILSQAPKILLAIYKEHMWVKKIVKKYSIDAVVSDNRFGLYQPGVPSVYITHQLLIKTGNYISEKILQKIHFGFIKKYTACWIPDFETTENIAGKLSHPAIPPINIGYIGGLSRFNKKEWAKNKYDLLIIISGPEPQRTIFEKILLHQLQQYNGKALLIRGLPGCKETKEKTTPATTTNLELSIKNHLSAEHMTDAIESATMVISRSGYTTVMDLIKLKQKAILVPTPGQTEQEYLASYLMEQHFFYTTSQDGFLLSEALKNANDFNFIIPSFDMEQYKKVVKDFVQSL